MAVLIGLWPWWSPSPSGVAPSPPPKKQTITQRDAWARRPEMESALMVAKGPAMARSGAASAKARKMTSITRRMVSVYPATGRVIRRRGSNRPEW